MPVPVSIPTRPRWAIFWRLAPRPALKWLCWTGPIRSRDRLYRDPSPSAAMRALPITSAPGAPRPDHRGAGPDVQFRAQDWSQAQSCSHGWLAAWRLVRLHGPELGESVAESAEPDTSDTVPGCGVTRGNQSVGRAGHGRALRAGRRPLDQRA